MKTIALLFSHPSHQIATFSLARKAFNSGDRVIYIGPRKGPEGENLVHHVEKNGFEFLELNIYSQVDPSSVDIFQNFLGNLIHFSVYEEFFNRVKVDLVLIDIFLAPVAIVLYGLKVPFVMASTIILADQDIFVPPLDKYLVPDNSKESEILIRQEWDMCVEGKKIRFQPYIDILQKISSNYGFDFDSYFYWSKSIVPFGFDFPELIFWDEEFDFPREKAKLRNKYYLGGQVFGAISHDTDFSIPSNFQTVIYVNLGTKDDTSAGAKIRLYDHLIDVAKNNKEYLFVISVPDDYEPIEKGLDNIIYCNYCPQLKILKKATIMLTHGGGSVKECIRYGVPMVCYPVDNDQFGNAARIVYHDLGLVGNINEDGSDEIEFLIKKLLMDDSVKKNIKYFQQRAIKAEENQTDVYLIDNLTKAIKNKISKI